MAFYIMKPWYKKSGEIITDGIYGAEWNGTSNPAWSRTDDAVYFRDPNPYYASMTTTPSSPFDIIMPWSGMKIVEDSDAGTLVEIPKFYYKWTRNGIKMKLQISMTQEEGYLCSPAHADRGDGVGERDYVYIARYHCTSGNRSVTGVLPTSAVTRASARTALHNLGTYVWQLDFAMWWTVKMLYLVEFANWDTQEMIGYGCGNNSAKQKTGDSDSLPYHTGTLRDTRHTYGTGVQYRYIEGLWENIYDWVDGIYFSGSNIYCIKNPSNFSDSSGGTLVGTRPTTPSGVITAFTDPTASGFEYALYPSSVNSSVSTSTYVCDLAYYNASGVALCSGAYFARSKDTGGFCLNGGPTASDKQSSRGCRLMVLPPSRITA